MNSVLTSDSRALPSASPLVDECQSEPPGQPIDTAPQPPDPQYSGALMATIALPSVRFATNARLERTP